jgi:hypothetical protein
MTTDNPTPPDENLDNDVQKPDTEASEAPEQSQPDDAPTGDAGAGDAPAAPNAEPTASEQKPEPPKSMREEIIRKLTGEDADKPEPAAEAPEADKPKEEAKPEPKAGEPDEPIPDTPITNEQVTAMKPGEARRKINRLLDERTKLRPLAGMASEIIQECQKAGLTPEDYKAWVKLGLGLQTGDPRALKAVADLAVKAGAIQVPKAEDVDVSGLESALKKAEDDFDLEHLRKEVAKLKEKKQPVTPVAPPPQPMPQPDTRAQQAEAHNRATAEIGRLADDYSKKVPAGDWEKLQPKIMSELAKFQGRHPDAWPAIFTAVVEKEIASIPKPAQVKPALTPGKTTSPARPVFKSERERAIHRLTT